MLSLENNDPGSYILDALKTEFAGTYELVSPVYVDTESSNFYVFGRDTYSCETVLINPYSTDTNVSLVESIRGNEIYSKEIDGDGYNYTFIKK